jgi:hypothetical protein
MNLIINLENDDWILDDMTRTMAEYGARESFPLARPRRRKLQPIFTSELI